MNPILLLSILVGYFALLFAVSVFTTKKGSDNASFFIGRRQSPWYLVAFGMIGASVSGVSVVSVPGMVPHLQFTYLQTVLGFFFGYVVIAYVLLPLFYKLNLISIYTYLRERFGRRSQKTGAFIFTIAKLIGAAAKLYVAILVLQEFIFNHWNVPFFATVCLVVGGIWLYTRRGGIKTIVWTDCLQTLFMLVALVLMVVTTIDLLGWTVPQIFHSLSENPLARVFVFDDWHSQQNFFKQFFSGIFIVIVMTGLDQEMMQKNLSCRTLKESRKNMLWYGAAFLPMNFLFLLLGFLIVTYATAHNIVLPAQADNILPFFAVSYLGSVAVICLMLSIIAASFSSADSALTAITTTLAMDILEIGDKETRRAVQLRKILHFAVSVGLILLIIGFKNINNQHIIDTIYRLVGYTYGPLLGLFAFGLTTKWQCNDRYVPYVALLAPVLTFLLQWFCQSRLNYQFGYELLMINGFITFVGLMFFSSRKHN